jgi:hypothetical protein
MRPPSIDDLVDAPVLAVISVVDTAVRVLARALRGLHPDIDCASSIGDAPQTVAAREIFDDCDLLLRSLDDYREALALRFRRLPADPDWPF